MHKVKCFARPLNIRNSLFITFVIEWKMIKWVIKSRWLDGFHKKKIFFNSKNLLNTHTIKIKMLLISNESVIFIKGLIKGRI